MEITVVQRLLGHSTVTTTANYLHVRQERLAQVKSPLQLLDLKPLPGSRHELEPGARMVSGSWQPRGRRAEFGGGIAGRLGRSASLFADASLAHIACVAGVSHPGAGRASLPVPGVRADPFCPALLPQPALPVVSGAGRPPVAGATTGGVAAGALLLFLQLCVPFRVLFFRN